MNPIAIMGDVVSQRTRRREHWWERHNNVAIPQFGQALEGLQQKGYVTELWVDPKKESMTLRWACPGNQWHVTMRTKFGPIKTILAALADHALKWIAAVENDLGNESNYAVREV